MFELILHYSLQKFLVIKLEFTIVIVFFEIKCHRFQLFQVQLFKIENSLQYFLVSLPKNTINIGFINSQL